MRAFLTFPAALVGLAAALPVLAAAVPIWIVNGLTAAVRRIIEPRALAWDAIIEYDVNVGWRPKPDLSGRVLDVNGDSFRFTTDRDGWRGRTLLSDSDVVVFGDSFAFGFAVDDHDFFADLLDGIKVKAIGCPAYSMVQPLLWMDKLRPHLEGKLVVWMVYLGNDLVDNLLPAADGYRQPFVRQADGGDWELTTDHVNPSPWPVARHQGGIPDYLKLCSSTPFGRRVFAACDHLIRRGKEICDAVGATLVVMTVPELSPAARRAIDRELSGSGSRYRDSFDEGLPEREILRICDPLGVEVLALRDHLTSDDYLPHDFHWTPQGHRRVADVLRALYTSHAKERSKISLTVQPAPSTGRPSGNGAHGAPVQQSRS